MSQFAAILHVQFCTWPPKNHPLNPYLQPELRWSVLVFIHDFELFSNNEAEQAARMIESQQKLLGYFRKEEDAPGRQSDSRVRLHSKTRALSLGEPTLCFSRPVDPLDGWLILSFWCVSHPSFACTHSDS